MGKKKEDSLTKILGRKLVGKIIELQRCDKFGQSHWSCLAQIKEISTGRNPVNNKKIKGELENQLKYIPILQPQPDLVFWCVDKDEKEYSVAIEAKIANQQSRMRSFYEGIGQALALNRLGFDYSGLYLYFLGDFAEIHKRGAETWSFVRNDLRLPLDFTYFQVKGNSDATDFSVMQYDGRQSGFELVKDINDPQFRITFKYPNPVKDNSPQREIQQALRNFLPREKNDEVDTSPDSNFTWSSPSKHFLTSQSGSLATSGVSNQKVRNEGD